MIEEIIKEIKNNKKCISCGASKYDNCECAYCGRINDNLKELTSKLVSVLPTTNNIDDITLVALFSVSDLGIKEINSILSKYNINPSIFFDSISVLFTYSDSLENNLELLDNYNLLN